MVVPEGLPLCRRLEGLHRGGEGLLELVRGPDPETGALAHDARANANKSGSSGSSVKEACGEQKGAYGRHLAPSGGPTRSQAVGGEPTARRLLLSPSRKGPAGHNELRHYQYGGCSGMGSPH